VGTASGHLEQATEMRRRRAASLKDNIPEADLDVLIDHFKSG
jgi:hypothetical protein